MQNRVNDLNEKYVQLETQWKISDDDHDTAIWEAEQKMRDLIETASLERILAKTVVNSKTEKPEVQSSSRYERRGETVAKYSGS